MSFLEYIVMFNKIKRDSDVLFLVSEDSFVEYKIGDIVLCSGFNGYDVSGNVFVIIDNNNIAVPVDYLYYSYGEYKNIDFVYQLDERKIVKKIGKISLSVISEYKKNFILLNKEIRVD